MKIKALFSGLALCLLAGLIAGPATAGTGETVTTLADQTGVAVTIYNRDLALVKDRRTLELPQGEVKLAFREVSARIRPETALFNGSGVQVIEQNFEFDLLTPKALLQKFVGRQVEVIRRHPTTGQESREKATVLSANQGVVLKFADHHIETGVPGRLSFPGVPESLRDRPTLTMLINNQKAGRKKVELSYLTSGLKWKADYVAELNAKDSALNLNGWVTLTNTSGATYRNARLQLVAGDVNQVAPEADFGRENIRMAKTMMAPAPTMAQEEMFEYHLYTLGRPTTIADRQTKQVALLQATAIPCRKEFVVRGRSYYYRQAARRSPEGEKEKVGVFVEIENRKQNHLGMPLPKGVVRVYKEDSRGSLQFVGEDRIDHTPENEVIRLKLGDAFDLTARRRQTDFKKIRGDRTHSYVYEAAFSVELKNAKAETATVKVLEPIPGDWKILSESQPHTRPVSNLAIWQVKVPAKGKKVLSYRVRVKF